MLFSDKKAYTLNAGSEGVPGAIAKPPGRPAGDPPPQGQHMDQDRSVRPAFRKCSVSIRTAFARWEKVSLKEIGRLAVVLQSASSAMKIGS